jgi:hypothetical protein
LWGRGRRRIYCVGIAVAVVPLANDKAKAAERFGFAFVSCHVEDYDVREKRERKK